MKEAVDRSEKAQVPWHMMHKSASFQTVFHVQLCALVMLRF